MLPRGGARGPGTTGCVELHQAGGQEGFPGEAASGQGQGGRRALGAGSLTPQIQFIVTTTLRRTGCRPRFIDEIDKA